jgi:hypothetical protein
MAVSACFGIAAATSSCSDFLDILPMNEVVLENYWTEKADVTSAVNGCYEAMADREVVLRMGIWGEMRSDNIEAGAGTPNEINEILKENLLPSNSLCNWSALYNVINRCNIVCHYAPEVESIDPNYTEAELKATIAEMVTLRSICYFYLIRAFRDVPYITEPSIDDNQVYIQPAMPFDQVLDHLIADLESVKNDALRRYSIEKVVNKSIVIPSENTSRITRWAIYALLADLYLWKGDWDNVIKNCELVIDHKRQLYKEMLLIDQVNDVDLFGDIPMILESVKGSSDVGNAYTEIFGSGNSFDSIFELYYRANQGKQNDYVNQYYGNASNSIGYLKAADCLSEGVSADKGTVFLTRRDCRYHESLESSGTSYAIAKYPRTRTSFSLQNLSNVRMVDSYRSSSDANWILYRLSDVILMKAEALAERGSDEDLDKAFELIDIVFKRSNSGNGLNKNTEGGSKSRLQQLVLAERQREFLFEGKRWFDLVRISRRDGNTTKLVENAIRKYRQDINVIRIKLNDPNYIYFPYSKDELKKNPLLHQNTAFNKGDEAVLK